MQKILSALLITAQIMTCFQLQADDSCDCIVTSHTFFSARSQYQSASPERVSLFHKPMVCDDGYGGALQVVLFGGKSGRKNALAKFFSPSCKAGFLVKEEEERNVVKDADLLASNFNVVTQNTTFESTISLEPSQKTFGLGLTYRQSLGHLLPCQECCDNPWWFECSTSLVHLEHCVLFKETVENGGGGVKTVPGLPQEQEFFDSMKEAFYQEAWKYGKIHDGKKLEKTGLADIELKLGYELIELECCGLEFYGGLHIPTGNRPKAEYVFEPIVGANKHWGFMGGTSAYFGVCNDDCAAVNFYFDLNITYLLRGKERRSLDLLNNGPWSRYLSVYENFEQATVAYNNSGTFGNFLWSPGINFFTQCVNVKPGFASTVNGAIEVASNCFSAEFGVNLFARQAECVSLGQAFKSGFAINARAGEGKTSVSRLINYDLGREVKDFSYGESNYEQTKITKSSFNLASAAHPNMLTYTLYGVAGYRFEDLCYCPITVGLGGSYELSRDNVGMNRWTLWGKCGLSF